MQKPCFTLNAAAGLVRNRIALRCQRPANFAADCPLFAPRLRPSRTRAREYTRSRARCTTAEAVDHSGLTTVGLRNFPSLSAHRNLTRRIPTFAPPLAAPPARQYQARRGCLRAISPTEASQTRVCPVIIQSVHTLHWTKARWPPTRRATQRARRQLDAPPPGRSQPQPQPNLRALPPAPTEKPDRRRPDPHTGGPPTRINAPSANEASASSASATSEEVDETERTIAVLVRCLEHGTLESKRTIH